jgi:ATP-binding cassette subfamily B protein
MPRPSTLESNLPVLWQLTKFFWPQVRKHRALAGASLLALFAEVGLRLLEPWPLKFVFDRLLRPVTAPVSWPTALDSLDPLTLLGWAALALVAFTGLRALAAYWSTIGFAHIGNRVITRLRTQLYRHVQYLSLSFHTKARTGDLVVRVISDVPMLAKMLIVIGMVAVMFWMRWELALVALALLPLFWLRALTLGRRIREVAQKQRRQEGDMAATAAESMHAIKTVQALSLEGAFARAFSSESDKSLKESVKAKRLAASLERSVDVLVAVATGLVLWQGGRLVLRGAMTPGDLLVFLAYLRYAYRPVQDLAKYTGRLAKASAAGERVLDLLERVPEVRDGPGATRAPGFRGQVSFEDIWFAYERGQRLLEGIHLQVEPGRHVALVGPSGGGKSTLVSLLLRLYDPQRGQVRIDGRDIRQFTLESLRSQISVVLQDNLLFAASVRDNIACAAPEATETEIEAAARLANAHGFIQDLPQGYDTVLGERGVTLSHGQRQRVAIARAAIRRAPILILDEPTTGLDQRNERAVLEALERLYRGRTTFLITHDLTVAAQADLILYLDHGQIVERGTHADLMQANGRYATLYRMQAGLRKAC